MPSRYGRRRGVEAAPGYCALAAGQDRNPSRQMNEIDANENVDLRIAMKCFPTTKAEVKRERGYFHRSRESAAPSPRSRAFRHDHRRPLDSLFQGKT